MKQSSHILFFLKRLPLPPLQQVTATVEKNTRPIIPRRIHKKTLQHQQFRKYAQTWGVHPVNVAPNVAEIRSKRYGDGLFGEDESIR